MTANRAFGWILAALALVAMALCFFLSPTAEAGQRAPIPGLQIIDGSTDNPAVGTCSLGAFSNALLVVTVDDNGAHSVTVESRACSTCPWVTESTLGSTVSPAAPYQFRAVGWFQSIRVSVANAGGDSVDAWCSLHD